MCIDYSSIAYVAALQPYGLVCTHHAWHDWPTRARRWLLAPWRHIRFDSVILFRDAHGARWPGRAATAHISSHPVGPPPARPRRCDWPSSPPWTPPSSPRAAADRSRARSASTAGSSSDRRPPRRCPAVTRNQAAGSDTADECAAARTPGAACECGTGERARGAKRGATAQG